MERPLRIASFALLCLAACGDPITSPTADPALTRASSGNAPMVLEANPTGERIAGRTALIPIFNGATGGLVFGSTPAGVALWPAHASPTAQAMFFLVVYPLGAPIDTPQCQDVPQETCPDHGPVIAGGAMQLDPAVYGDGVMGHDHISPPNGSAYHATQYPVLVLFTSKGAATQRLTTRAAVDAAVAAGDAFVAPFTDFSFLNALVDQHVYGLGTPWVCPPYTYCQP